MTKPSRDAERCILSLRGRGRKKPWRYRWPEDFRDEVLARLLALNAERAEQERLTGLAAEAAEKARKPGKNRSKKKSASPDQKKSID